MFELVLPAWFKSDLPVLSEPEVSAIGSAVAVAESPDVERATESAEFKTRATREQELMRRSSFAADVWSLGCVYAEFLHSRILFQTNGSADVSLLATIAARIGLPEKGILEIKGWPEDRILELAKALSLASTLAQCNLD